MKRTQMHIVAFAFSGCMATSASAATIVTRVASEPHLAVSHPNAALGGVPGGVIVGGGAFTVFTTGIGNMLWAAAPALSTASTVSEWHAAANDHLSPSPATLSIFSLNLKAPNGLYETRVFADTGSLGVKAMAQANVPSGWVMTDGGCRVNRVGARAVGEFLTASYPDKLNEWFCATAPDGDFDRVSVTAFAVAIRPVSITTPLPRSCIGRATGTSMIAPHAEAPDCSKGAGAVTGGGAKVNLPIPNCTGLFLTGTFPLISGTKAYAWKGQGLLHASTCPGATVTAYSIAVKF
jgi:hypothetical protein